MSVKKVSGVCLKYEDFSLGYDNAWGAISKGLHYSQLGFDIVKSGVLLANTQRVVQQNGAQYDPERVQFGQIDGRSTRNSPNRNPNFVPVPHPSNQLRDDELELLQRKNNKPRPF